MCSTVTTRLATSCTGTRWLALRCRKQPTQSNNNGRIARLRHQGPTGRFADAEHAGPIDREWKPPKDTPLVCVVVGQVRNR